MKKLLIIDIQIETDATDAEIKKAIEKGIYYGLDIKHVCMPRSVEKIEVEIYNV